MSCQRCNSKRLLNASGKSSDCNSGGLATGKEFEGYIPDDLGIGGGDYFEIEVCLDCGQLQGTWPMPKTSLEKPMEPEEFDAGTYTLKEMQDLLDNIKKEYGEDAKLCFSTDVRLASISLEVG